MVGMMPLSQEIAWDRLSFASTLYLYPIIETLLEHAPLSLHDELRLGLQEALVNAAKHGNCLDPEKQVSVRYAQVEGCYWWVIADQGCGFSIPSDCCLRTDVPSDPQNTVVSECGRGLFILHQIFDQVYWSPEGNEVHLCKTHGTWRSSDWGEVPMATLSSLWETLRTPFRNLAL